MIRRATLGPWAAAVAVVVCTCVAQPPPAFSVSGRDSTSVQAAAAGQPGVGEGLTQFYSSKQRFSVSYPSGWFQAEGVAEILDITNFHRARDEEGIALKVGGAEVAVNAAPPDVRSVDDWLNRDVPDDASVMGGSSVEQAQVPLPSPPEDGCRTLRRVSWREEIAIGAYFARTMYYCSASAGLFRIALTNWDGDPAQNRLRKIALAIALSLRTR